MLGRPAEYPCARAERGIPDAVGVEVARALVPVGDHDGQASGKTPAPVELVIDGNVKQAEVGFHLVMQALALQLLHRPHEVP